LNISAAGSVLSQQEMRARQLFFVQQHAMHKHLGGVERHESKGRDQPPLAAYDDRRWVELAGYAQVDFQTSLQAFSLRRAELVAC
jgi:hypothetical protein